MYTFARSIRFRGKDDKGFDMFSTSFNHQSASAFDFSMRTSSGDKISLHAYDNTQVEMDHQKDAGMESMALSLRHEYGYSFSYSGDSIDKQDQKEIEAALKKIKPLLNILNPDHGFEATDKKISDRAMDINALLPKAKDNNHQNFMKDSLVDMMDKMLKAFKANDDMVKLAKDVFDALDAQMKGLSLYA